ncbi:coiled-coil domain-containing protein 106b isoform X2 [Denticeps clupeoides]|uniref:coiled-coil domain-containing protein 106b isoform X2 n=1 Tax=Denticeps clupeoides TaxID=299321 RepID=UPI0010A56A81|nr:coiled-coil domain-containing protein 106 isoform X2 [Denticeps clupeoides]
MTGNNSEDGGRESRPAQLIPKFPYYSSRRRRWIKFYFQLKALQNENMSETQTSPKNTAGDMKNEEGYEISIPFEENSVEPSALFSQAEQMFEVSTSGGQSGHCSPYLLISSLRMQLQMSLEKNSWLQKRIEDLEEERDFLRCQLDRFIFTTKNQEASEPLPDLPQPSPQKAQPRRSSTLSPATRVTRSGLARLQNQSAAQTRKRVNSAQEEEEEEEVVEEEYLEEDGYLEEEELLEDDDDDDDDDKGRKAKKGRSGSKMCVVPRVKRTRIFRIARGMERQRVKDPAGVLLRYKKILVTYQKLKSMSKAFQVHGVDRNTVASTTPIAELLLVAPEKVSEVGEFDASKEKLLDYARRCYKALDETTHAKVQALKKTNLLLPISYRFRN